MSYLLPHQVQNPNVVDSSELAELVKDAEGPVPDFYIWFNHPTEPGVVCHVPCRELDTGEIFVLDSTYREKRPEIPKAWQNVPIQDYNEEQREWYVGFSKENDKLEAERNITATVQVILQEGWTEALVRKLLPKRAHRAAYNGGTAMLREQDPVVSAFLGASAGGAQANATEVPRSVADE